MKTWTNRLEMVASIAEGSAGAEIGVQSGEFSREILSLPISRLFLIDSWRHQKGEYALDVANVNQGAQDALFRSVVMGLGLIPNVFIMRMDSLEASNFLYGLDWFFLDSNHTKSAVYADLKAWSRCLKPGGRIMGHDYTNRPEAKAQGFGVIEAVDAFCSEEGWEMTGITDEAWPSYLLEKI